MPSNGRGPMTGGRVRGWIRGRLSRKRLTVVGTLAVLAVGVVVVVRALDADAVVAAAGAADPTLLVVALGVYVLSWPVRGRRYADVLAAMGRRCRTGFLTATVFASQTANLIVPARAGDGSARTCSRTGATCRTRPASPRSLSRARSTSWRSASSGASRSRSSF